MLYSQSAFFVDPCEKCQVRFHSREEIEQSANFLDFDIGNSMSQQFYMCDGTCVDSTLTCLPEERSENGYWINGIYYISTLDMKGCICHFKEWQIHPFISKVKTYLIPCSKN